MIKINLNNRSFLIALSLLLLTTAHIYSLFFFPPTEGWWQTYGFLYNQHLALYKDINIAYTPLFVIFNSYLIKISDLFVFHRIVGLFFVLMTFVFIFLSLEKMKYSFIVSIVSALIATLLAMLNVVYIVYDYPILLNLLLVISMYCFFLSIENDSSVFSIYLTTMLTAFFTILVFFTKQNIGILLIMAYLSAYLYLIIIDRSELRKVNLIIFLMVSIVFFITLMNLTNMHWETVQLLTVQNDSKGSPLTVLLRITEKENLKIFGKAIFYFLLIALVIKLKIISLISNKLKIEEHHILLILFVSLLLLFLSRPEKAAILLSIVYVLYLGFVIYWKKREGVLFFFLGIQVLAITMTAGLCIAGVFVIFSFAMAFVLDFFEKKIRPEYFTKLLYLIAISLFLSVSYTKMNFPYQWWGLNQSKISDAKYTLPFEEMKYLKVDKMTSTFFNDVKKYADREQNASLYFYPHIPIFYKLYDTYPISNNLVQWFDVISTKNLKSELDILKSKQPDLIVVLDPPWTAYIGHASLKSSDLLQPQVINHLDEGVANGTYRLEKYQIFDNNIFGDNLGRYEKIDISLKVSNPAIFGKSYDEVFNENIENDFLVKSIKHTGMEVTSIDGYKFVKNDVVTIQVKLSSLNELVKKIGTPDITEQKFYSYRIYTKNRDLNETR